LLEKEAHQVSRSVLTAYLACVKVGKRRNTIGAAAETRAMREGRSIHEAQDWLLFCRKRPIVACAEGLIIERFGHADLERALCWKLISSSRQSTFGTFDTQFESK
jgi:hypothetical protein